NTETEPQGARNGVRSPCDLYVPGIGVPWAGPNNETPEARQPMNPTVPIANWGDAVLLSVTNALNNFLAAIPLIVGALLILLIGWILSNIVARLVTRLLAGAGVDRVFAQHGGAVYPEGAMRYTP